jgi:4a-hydroxytetrahydrobiopterin dehydratase
MSSLKNRHCVPCEGGVPKLTEAKAEELRRQTPAWTLSEDASKIERKFRFEDFRQAMAFVNRVAAIANEEDHHPDILVNYSRVTLTLWTHAIGGLSENDFIVAAKIDALR